MCYMNALNAMHTIRLHCSNHISSITCTVYSMSYKRIEILVCDLLEIYSIDFCCRFKRITSHIAMVDAFPKKLEGEGMDFVHGSVFMGNPKIEYDTGKRFLEFVSVAKNITCYNERYN